MSNYKNPDMLTWQGAHDFGSILDGAEEAADISVPGTVDLGSGTLKVIVFKV